ncbi:MAG: hypothetical protein WCF67_09525 [Chitinophagaceae bacterium]
MIYRFTISLVIAVLCCYCLHAQPSPGKAVMHVLKPACKEKVSSMIEWYAQPLAGDTTPRLIESHQLSLEDTVLGLSRKGSLLVWKLAEERMTISIRNLKMFYSISVLIDSIQFKPGNYVLDASKFRYIGYNDPRKYACSNCYELTARHAPYVKK